MNLSFKMLKSDFKRNRAGNMALILFMALAAGLVVAATIVVTQLFTSINGMYETAKPPHFLQMHKGEMNQEAIDEFNASYDGVTGWQTVALINVYGDDLRIYGQDTFDLSDCILGISFVKQNPEYDLLLDKDRNKIHMEKGEIGIPVILLDSYDINLGDTLVLTGNGVTREFTVTAFVHDAQMNSTMCSSTRMLISDGDFEEFFGNIGEQEYIIETYFTDSGMASGYQSAYEKAGLPQNGPAITYTMIFLLSAFTDIMMAMVYILVSVLLVLVALQCMKYTVMAAMEEEIGEIGTMKAIGMSYEDIRNLYLGKIKILVAAGIVLGFVLATICAKGFTGHVSGTFGSQPVSILTIGIPVAACGILLIITNHYCKKILKKLKKITVVDALVTGKGFGKKERVRDGLYQSRRMSVDLLLSVREIVHNFSGFFIVFVVMCIVSGIMIVPVNLLLTMESKEFISYMGSSVDDILIELEQGENLENRYENMIQLLDHDADIEMYQEFRRVRAVVMNAEGEEMILHIDSGDHVGEGLVYLNGNTPSMENEMALSKLNADEIGKSTGDTIMVSWEGSQKKFTISGIYQDVTNGGYSAKAVHGFAGADSEQYSFSVNLGDGIKVREKADLWSSQMGGGYTIEPMEEFINQTLGGVTRQIRTATIAVVVIGILLAALIVLLFMKLRLAKDASQIAAMKAIGFNDSDIRKQYLYKISLVAVIGIAAGTLVSNFWGDNIASMAFSMMGLGITRITFFINPWITFFLIPVVLLAVAAGMTIFSSGQIKEYHIISLINE